MILWCNITLNERMQNTNSAIIVLQIHTVYNRVRQRLFGFTSG